MGPCAWAASFTHMAAHLFFKQTFLKYLLFFTLCVHVCTCTHACVNTYGVQKRLIPEVGVMGVVRHPTQVLTSYLGFSAREVCILKCGAIKRQTFY